MSELDHLFSPATVARLEGYPAVRNTVIELILADQLPAARLLAFVVAMAERRGRERDELRLALGLRPSNGMDRL